METNQLTELIIGCAIKVHSKLGPGLLESAYQACLAHELKKTGIEFVKEHPLPINYDDELIIDCAYKADLFVGRKVIVEIKSVGDLDDIHLAQVLTYLRLTETQIGLLINFNVLRLKDGLKRVLNKYYNEI